MVEDEVIGPYLFAPAGAWGAAARRSLACVAACAAPADPPPATAGRRGWGSCDGRRARERCPDLVI
jgi:hypothetical protein